MIPTERKLVLEGEDGKVLRAFAWDGHPVQVIRRGDTKRLELLKSTQALQLRQIPFELVGELSIDSLDHDVFVLGQAARLKLLPQVQNTVRDAAELEESPRGWRGTVLAVLMLGIALVSVLISQRHVQKDNSAEMKEEVIKIVKRIPPRQKTISNMANQPEEAKVAPTDKPKSIDRIKRMGALAALGSLSKSNQKGGINLGAVNTTAGPGLGGNAGSGGVQTSLYAKGLTAAPVGVGGKIEGAGGYGTKGKGGGQAGYGKMSLVGSTGAAPVGLAQEATVESGLDRDQIAAVINRNLGQVRFCYEQGLQSEPNLSGRVAVGFTIDGTGKVQVANVENTSLNSKMIEECIVLRLKSWKFPLPRGGALVKVSYPFVLRRAGQG